MPGHRSNSRPDDSRETLTLRRITVFWCPLALTWLMMALEGPILAAIVARLAEPKANLAAHGVAIAIAIIIEAPVIMIMSASTALARDRSTFLRLRTFTYLLNAAITLVMAGLLFTPGMDLFTRDLIGLPDQVADLVHTALLVLLPWPAAIGYRRFYQGLLIANGQTRRVATGTAIRLGTMCVVGFGLYFSFDIPGAVVSAAALSAGVTIEAIAARLMSIEAVRWVLSGEARPPSSKEEGYSYREIGRFYAPLALTSTISLAVHPMVTFFVGQGRFPLESLAVIPVVNALVFVFRAIGISFQEVAIAFLGDRAENYGQLKRFGLILGASVTLGLGAIAFSPLSVVWFEWISGLSPELARFALAPARILVLIPPLSVLLSLQRAVMVKSQRTLPLTWATCIEVVGVLGVLYLTIETMGMIGAVGAAIALLAGRIGGNLYLLRPCRDATRPQTTDTPAH